MTAQKQLEAAEEKQFELTMMMEEKGGTILPGVQRVFQIRLDMISQKIEEYRNEVEGYKKN